MAALHTFTTKAQPLAADEIYLASAADSYNERRATLASLLTSQTLLNCTLTNPVLTTPSLGVASATTINKVALTAPATGCTLTIADGKTLAANASLTLAGTDGTTMTFPSTSATLARTDAANTFTGVQTMTSAVLITPVLGVASATSLATSAAVPLLLTNAATVSVSLTAQTVGNATLTIPDFAGVSDEIVCKTKAVTMSNKTFVAPVLGVASATSLAVSGLLTSSSPSAGIGYATGAGSTVTQLTNRATGVTINAICGNIVTMNTSLSAGAEVLFTVTNSSVAAGDVVAISCKGGQTADTSFPYVYTVAAGSFIIALHNRNASTADTGAMTINFAIIKAVTA